MDPAFFLLNSFRLTFITDISVPVSFATSGRAEGRQKLVSSAHEQSCHSSPYCPIQRPPNDTSITFKGQGEEALTTSHAQSGPFTTWIHFLNTSAPSRCTYYIQRKKITSSVLCAALGTRKDNSGVLDDSSIMLFFTDLLLGCVPLPTSSTGSS